ncbi:MAG: tRNA pseudouridine(38-40) synthase TruA, partial [Gemmatimonadota bacterium]
MSRTFLMLLHYDGGGFVGWQRQSIGRTIQGEIEAVLGRICDQKISAHAAGRTDAGVHSMGMGVSVVVPDRWSPISLRRAVNALLPEDCWIEQVLEMVPEFHARKSAKSRRYQYLVGTDDAASSPFRRPFEWALSRDLDLAAMGQAACAILGTHDFQAFAAKGTPKPHYRCSVHLAEWEIRPEQAGLRFDIAADRFLHHMVRMLVGTMVDIGLARRPVSDMIDLLARTDNDATSPPAPPQGLYFISAEYPAT